MADEVSNDEAFAALDEQIRRLRTLRAAEDAAPEVANELDALLREQIAAGEAPDGTPWPPTQAGERPLRNAAAALECKALGPVVLATLRGPTALHHMGHARGGVKRQILPSAKLPQRFTEAVRRACLKAMHTAITGE